MMGGGQEKGETEPTREYFKSLPHISPSIKGPDSVFRSSVNLRVQLWPEKTGKNKMA